MASIFFMKPLLKKMEQGVLFKTTTAWLLRILALLLLLSGLGSFGGLWYQIVTMFSIKLLIAGILLNIFTAISYYMVIHTLLLRSNDLLKIPGSGFTILPILSLCLKLIGEVLFCIVVPSGIGIACAIPLAGSVINEKGFGLPYMFTSMNIWISLLFAGGLVLASIIAGLIVLGFFYLVSEFIITTVTIARHSKVMRKVAETYYKKNM